jgi:hypothetical protein
LIPIGCSPYVRKEPFDVQNRLYPLCAVYVF